MKNAQQYIDNKLKPPKAFFDWCYSQIHTFKWENKQKTIVASDRKNCHVIEKRLTKRTNLTFFDKFYSFAIILVTAKRIEIQTYCFWSRIEEGKQTIESELSNFEQFANDEHIKVTTQGEDYFFGLSKMTNYGGPYTHTKFYSNNWRDRIKNVSELRYLDFNVDRGIDISHCYKYRSEIEFLQKIKARKLAEEVMYSEYNYSSWGGYTKTVDMRTINEKWLRENKQFFKNSDHSFLEYELERRVKERNGKVVPCIEQYLTYKDINKISKGVGIISFQNWVIKNRVDFKYYLDYLNVLKDLNIAIDSKNLIMPKDLTAAHNNAVELLNQIKQEKREKELEISEKKYRERNKKLKRMNLEIDEYCFRVPENLKELIVEGKALHHCVGSSGYVSQHREGKTTILFIRRKEDPGKPLYTMEYKSGRIIQIRGKHNQDPPEDIKQAAEEWLKAI